MKNLFLLALSVVFVSGCSTSSDVSTGDLKAPFTENKAQVESCYEKVAKKQPDLGNGTVELKFLIDENGKAYKTIFMKKKSTLSNKLLNACLKKVVHGWQFPTGKSIEVIYPFQFEKATASMSTDAPAAKTPTGVSSDAPEKQSDLDVIDTSPKEDETSGDEEDDEDF